MLLYFRARISQNKIMYIFFIYLITKQNAFYNVYLNDSYVNTHLSRYICCLLCTVITPLLLLCVHFCLQVWKSRVCIE
jgi:hypothetical protein